ncbi:MAG TPA: hypothetical protein VF208_07335, partial [Candidatus Binatia bacterium]
NRTSRPSIAIINRSNGRVSSSTKTDRHADATAKRESGFAADSLFVYAAASLTGMFGTEGSAVAIFARPTEFHADPSDDKTPRILGIGNAPAMRRKKTSR